MKAVRVKLIMLLAACLTIWSACSAEHGTTSVAAGKPSSNAVERVDLTNDSPKQAQPKLQTIKLWVGTNEVSAEIARTFTQIQTGMMWRTNMAEMEGMLFVFPVPNRVSFWMRNTLLPLSCAYIDREGTILEIHDMKPRDETPIPSATDQVSFVLEVNQGWFERHGVKPGMLIATERGALGTTFFGRR